MVVFIKLMTRPCRAVGTYMSFASMATSSMDKEDTPVKNYLFCGMTPKLYFKTKMIFKRPKKLSKLLKNGLN